MDLTYALSYLSFPVSSQLSTAINSATSAILPENMAETGNR